MQHVVRVVVDHAAARGKADHSEVGGRDGSFVAGGGGCRVEGCGAQGAVEGVA